MARPRPVSTLQVTVVSPGVPFDFSVRSAAFAFLLYRSRRGAWVELNLLVSMLNHLGWLNVDAIVDPGARPHLTGPRSFLTETPAFQPRPCDAVARGHAIRSTGCHPAYRRGVSGDDTARAVVVPHRTGTQDCGRVDAGCGSCDPLSPRDLRRLPRTIGGWRAR